MFPTQYWGRFEIGAPILNKDSMGDGTPLPPPTSCLKITPSPPTLDITRISIRVWLNSNPYRLNLRLSIPASKSYHSYLTHQVLHRH